MKLFRKNTWDRAIADSVINHKEYGKDLKFKNAVVVDIGAHIGSFSFLAISEGAKTVRAYEAFSENFVMAKANTTVEGSLCDVQVLHRAVWRSDRESELLHFQQCSDAKNTGGGTVFGQSDVNQVETISLDQILDELPEVDILKLDCEGSEYPILFTCTKLDRVKRIVGEYHNMGYNIPDSAQVGDYAQYTFKELKVFLTEKGFTVHTVASNDHLGKFFAVRNLPAVAAAE